MSDKVLSQHEIEALMSALAEGDDAPAGAAPPEPPRKIKAYDFLRPEKFSKEHLRALRILHGSFSRSLASSLSSHLRSNVQVRLTMIEQVSYEDYIRALPNPTIVYVASLAPLPGQVVVEVNLELAHAVLDRLLGGSGLLDNRAAELTEIEMALLKILGGLLAASLRETWADVVDLQPTLQEAVLSPDLVQVTLPTETTVMLTFEAALLQTTGTISICLPHPALQPIMDKLTVTVWAVGLPNAADDTSRAPASHEQLGRVPLTISVELGRAQLRVRELVSLARGQVIKLDTPANGDLQIRVGGRPKLAGRPGLAGTNLAVQVTRSQP